jgi:hypothetical protein
VTQESLVLIEGDTSGVWTTPETVDPGPERGAYCDHAYDASIGYVFSEYDGTHRSLVYVDSVRTGMEWEYGQVTASADDIGKYCSAVYHQDGSISVSCRNVTQESLLLIEGDTSGVWAAPQIIDPGPERGAYCDHQRTPSGGYRFSEYDGVHRSLVYVDSVLTPFEWDVGVVSDRFESGRFVSSCLAPDGRIASSFYFYNDIVLGSVLISGTDDAGRSVVKAVVDSIAGTPSSNVYIDMAVTPEWSWHITYRSPIDNCLWYATVDSYVVTGTGGENGEPPLPLPVELLLFQNMPNPFNPVTAIRFYLPRDADAALSIYAVNGKLVRTLVDGRLPAGLREVAWDARNDAGKPVASGVYFYRLTAEGQALTRKMVLLR